MMAGSAAEPSFRARAAAAPGKRNVVLARESGPIADRHAKLHGELEAVGGEVPDHFAALRLGGTPRELSVDFVVGVESPVRRISI